jgi:iron complex outermembrane receptor protein
MKNFSAAVYESDLPKILWRHRDAVCAGLFRRCAARLPQFVLCLSLLLPPAWLMAQSAGESSSANQPPAASQQSAPAAASPSAAQPDDGRPSSSSQSSDSASSPAPAKDAATPARLHTSTVVNVVGKAEPGYAVSTVQVGVAGPLPLLDTPAAVTAVTRQMLDDKQSRLLSDAIKNDASIGENYAPVGYYGDFAIRGFVLDLATALKINNLTIAGEQDVALENKERVEFLKGLAGIESGVAAPGGLVNYVTKRPATVHTLTLGTDDLGSSYGATDMGGLFGARNQLGLRVNVAGEDIHSYVHNADGSREFGSLAADWQATAHSQLSLDFEYQNKVQRSVSGYQLLGGTTVPDKASASIMLGEQWWAKPNTFDTYNLGSRYQVDFKKDWQFYLTGGRSHSLIDDNVAYVYGNSVSAPYNNFSSAGDYDVYDYRSPNELRVDEQAAAGVLGKVATGPLTHNLAAGYEAFRRLVSLTDSVYDYVGTENIYQPLQTFAPSPNEPSNYYRRLNSSQYAFFVSDRIEWGSHWQATVGGRQVLLHDHKYNRASETDPIVIDPTDRTVWLPQYSLVYKPVARLSIYGSYSETLSLGQQAPWWATNANLYLNPFYTRQVEVGAKYRLGDRFNLTAALFRLRTPFQYAQPNTGGTLTFVQEGRETHDGVELGLDGRLSRDLSVAYSATALSAQSEASGTASYDHRQLPNVPHFRSSLTLDYTLPRLRTLHLLPGWDFTGRKAAGLGGVASVPSYSIFNLGARFAPKFTPRMTYSVYAENLFDKFYWKDTGFSYGDTFLQVGAPRSARIAVTYSF